MQLLTNIINAVTTPVRYLSQWFMRIVPGLKRIPAISLPSLLAISVFLFLLIVVTTFLFIYRYNSDQLGQKSVWEWVIAYSLSFAIPIAVYWLVRLWMSKEESRYPEIERIWHTGLEQCQQQGIHLTRVPIFLVLGARDQQQIKHLMHATGISFLVEFPPEPADISFYANQDALFLFVTGCSCISGLSTAPLASQFGSQSNGINGGVSPTFFGGTIDASQLASGSGQTYANTSPVPTQTLTDDQFPAGSVGSTSGTINPLASPANSQASARESNLGSFQGTIMLPAEGGLQQILGPQDSKNTAVAQLSSKQMYEKEQKLRYVCSLIRTGRQNLCPINGMITLLPFSLIENSSGQVQTAAQKDLATLREELMVRCSNTILVTELESVDGFTELIKRVGDKRTSEFRFGKGCEVWNAPEGKRLEALAMHAVGAFEDWIYMLFQEENALRQRYNSRLFMLLCRIRGGFAQNLKAVLSRGFGFDPQTECSLASEQFLFGGCYFGAAGNDPSRQAFIKSVFMKGIQQEGELEWLPEARRRDSQLQLVANLFALLATASFLAIVVMLGMKFGPLLLGK
ncbi:MAG: hypothetical protein KDB03_11510 [Planctomycetales bacterium]|nr:hypothetical protein [Planctomycetales bacterium]